jgi:hypothetical protein
MTRKVNVITLNQNIFIKMFSVSCSAGKTVIRRKVERNAKLVGGKRQG